MKSRSGTKKKPVPPSADPAVELQGPPVEVTDEERALAEVDEREDCELPPVLRPPAAPAGFPQGVRAVLREARPLVTIPLTHGVWSRAGRLGIKVKSAFVRIYPPPGAEDSRVEEVAAALRAAGAEGVKVMPRPPVPTVHLGREEEWAMRRVCSPREVVRGLAGDSASPGLLELLSQALDAGEQKAAAEGVLMPLPGPALFVKGVELHNWLRYAGLHVLELESTIYGVTARQEGDPERSNWLGKTSVLEAIAFALFGWHRWPTEDAWITRGEKEGGVKLVLSDGTLIYRHRRKSTQLSVLPLGGAELNGEHAQREIDRRVGLAEDDFFATCFFRQKDLARLIKAKPAERLEIVRGWLALEPVVYAEAFVRERLDAKITALNRVIELIAGATRARARLVEQVPAEWRGEERVDFESWARALAGAEQGATNRAREIEAEAATVNAANDGLARWEQDAAGAARRVRLSAERDRLCAQLPGMQQALGLMKVTLEARVKAHAQGGDAELEEQRHRLPVLQSGEQEALVRLRGAQDEANQKQRLAAGAFDGVCPVAAIECPAKAAINAPRERNRELHAAAKVAVGAAEKTYTAARGEVQEIERVFAKRRLVEQEIHAGAAAVQQQVQVIERHEAGVAKIEAEMKAFEPAQERIARDGQPQRRPVPDARPAWEVVKEATARTMAAKRARTDHAELSDEIVTYEQRRVVLEHELCDHRAALRILGKGGAQKDRGG